jgi:hypothetical protein
MNSKQCDFVHFGISIASLMPIYRVFQIISTELDGVFQLTKLVKIFTKHVSGNAFFMGYSTVTDIAKRQCHWTERVASTVTRLQSVRSFHVGTPQDLGV